MLGNSGVERHHAGGPSRSAGVRSDVGASEVLRTQLCSAAVALVGEVGYARTTVDRVARLSGNSQETFHKCFEDVDDCLLAALEGAIGRIAAVLVPAYEGEREWPAKVRAALAALLAMIEDEPAMSTFVFVGALGAGPKVLASRMEALERLKIAFERGLDEAGMVDGREVAESSPLSAIRELSPLSAEGAVNGALGILHTRLLEGSPLARRPLSELAGPLTAMIVLPYVGRALAARQLTPGRSRPSRVSERRSDSKVRPKAGARKRKRPRLTAKQRAILKALKDGPLTVRELVDLTGWSDQTTRNKLNGLEARDEIVKTERDGRVAYDLCSKKRAAAERKLAGGSSSSNGAAASNGAGSSTSNGAGSATSNGAGALAATSAFHGAGVATSNGAGASNGHDRSVPARAMLQGLDIPISEREFKVLTAIGELNARGSSPSNHAIRDATEIMDPAEVSMLLKQLARRGLVESTATGRQTYAWRLTTKGAELLHELEAHAVGAETPAAGW
jgi:AcrR family transcriptional regulator/DNA-binding MarR family transcriptional regulator